MWSASAKTQIRIACSRKSKGRSEGQPLSRQHADGGYLPPQYRSIRRQSIDATKRTAAARAGPTLERGITVVVGSPGDSKLLI